MRCRMALFADEFEAFQNPSLDTLHLGKIPDIHVMEIRVGSKPSAREEGFNAPVEAIAKGCGGSGGTPIPCAACMLTG